MKPTLARPLTVREQVLRDYAERADYFDQRTGYMLIVGDIYEAERAAEAADIADRAYRAERDEVAE